MLLLLLRLEIGLLLLGDELSKALVLLVKVPPLERSQVGVDVLISRLTVDEVLSILKLDATGGV